jgi:transposase
VESPGPAGPARLGGPAATTPVPVGAADRRHRPQGTELLWLAAGRHRRHAAALRAGPGPVSQVTEDFLAWVCERLAAEGRQALLLVWDNASWHVSQRVRAWSKAHNRRAKAAGGVRLLACRLPSKSPWLNPIEPKWRHGKRAILEAERVLTAQEVQHRVYEHYGCEQGEPLVQKVA